MGLRLKLGLYVVGFVGAVLAISGYLSLQEEAKIRREEAENRGKTLLRAFAIPSSIAMANNDSYVAKPRKATEAAWLFYKFLLGKYAQPEMLAMG